MVGGGSFGTALSDLADVVGVYKSQVIRVVFVLAVA